MLLRKNRLALFGLTAIVPLLLMLMSLGCAHLEVTPLSNRSVIDLDADDIARIMHRAGFSDEQILELGTDLRNSLALQGAAQIRVRSTTQAIFAVHYPYVHVASHARGSFIYNVETKEFR